jgi:hypothetical protein
VLPVVCELIQDLQTELKGSYIFEEEDGTSVLAYGERELPIDLTKKKVYSTYGLYQLFTLPVFREKVYQEP